MLYYNKLLLHKIDRIKMVALVKISGRFYDRCNRIFDGRYNGPQIENVLMAIKTAFFPRQQIFCIYYIYDSSCAPGLQSFYFSPISNS